MSTTLLLKRIDLWVQLLALAIPVMTALMKKEEEYLILCYFSVAAVQIISCIANKIQLDDFSRAGGRRKYEVTLLVITGLTGIVWLGYKVVPSIVLFYGLLLLLIGFVMSIWYCILTIEEIDFVKKQIDRKQYV